MPNFKCKFFKHNGPIKTPPNSYKLSHLAKYVLNLFNIHHFE